MTSSLETGHSDIEALAQQTGFTPDAVASMMRSIRSGGGGMAQFDHPEFGGAGQWMSGGMLMTSDFSNRDLQQRIARLCDAIVEHVAHVDPPAEKTHQSQSPSAGTRERRDWWPAALGVPDTSGAQNDMRYAWFADERRLAIEEGGSLSVYDTEDHRITGVSQQQGGERTLAFTSQRGVVDRSTLPLVSGGHDDQSSGRRPGHADESGHAVAATHQKQSDPFAALEKLAGLHARGIVADDEFAKKKAELLARL